MSVLMRISADRPALKWNEPSGKARARWVRNAHGSVFSCIQVSGSHRHTHTPLYPYGFMCFAKHKHTIELQRCTYFFCTYPYFPYNLRSSYFLLLPCTHTLVLLYPCPTVFYLDTQNCVCRASICKPVLQTPLCPLPYDLTDTPLRTDTDICPCPSATRSLPHHFSLFLKSPSVTISNFHKRHVSFRLVLKGNVFVDSHTSRPLGSQNHLWQMLWLRPLE